MIRAFILSAIAAALIAQPAAAQWPTDCTAINDVFESSLGNDDNVGIYQLVFGDQAEQACQNDHRDEVRNSFAWALDDSELANGGPIEYPRPPETYAAYELVRSVAISRGASDLEATAIAQTIIPTGNWGAFLYGKLPDIPYGEYACDWNSDQCPLAPVIPYEVQNWGWRWIDREGLCWQFATQFDIRNNMAKRLHFAWIDIGAIDGDGYLIDKLTVYDIGVAPHSSRHISETKQICDGLGKLVETLRLSYKPS